MKRFLLPGLLALCVLPARAQSFADELTGLFLLRREIPTLCTVIAADGFREVSFRKGVMTLTRGTDTVLIHARKGQVFNITYSTRNTKLYQKNTAGWTLLGFEEGSMGKMIETGPEKIYLIFGIRYKNRVVYSIAESMSYSKKVEDDVLD